MRWVHELLTDGGVQIRVVPKDRVFIHGKAGVIEKADGTKTCFLGSINETKSAFAKNYEILWEDESPEGVAWVEEEFAALWEDAYPLPDAIIEEIERVAKRVEIRFRDLKARSCRPQPSPRRRFTAGRAAPALAARMSSLRSSNTGKPTARHGCSLPMRWASERRSRPRQRRWSHRFSKMVRC